MRLFSCMISFCFLRNRPSDFLMATFNCSQDASTQEYVINSLKLKVFYVDPWTTVQVSNICISESPSRTTCHSPLNCPDHMISSLGLCTSWSCLWRSNGHDANTRSAHHLKQHIFQNIHTNGLKACLITAQPPSNKEDTIQVPFTEEESVQIFNINFH